MTDKTGTLTKNQMTVRSLWCQGREFAVSGTGYTPEGAIELIGGSGSLTAALDDARLMLQTAALCCDARLIPPRHNGQSWQSAQAIPPKRRYWWRHKKQAWATRYWLNILGWLSCRSTPSANE
jgi:hypothetical protein